MEHKELAVGIWQYDFPESVAKNIVDMVAQSKSLPWIKSGIGNDDMQDQDVRTSQTISLDESLPFWAQEVRKTLTEAINDYSGYFNAPVNQDEGLNLLRYRESNKYDYHSDGAWSIYRTSSALVYLNPSEYEGGATHFKHFDISVKPEKPAIVLFPSNHTYLHAAMPVTEGEKYVLVTWMNDLPVGWDPGILNHLARATGGFRR
jgi:predicted 2-oxoglutarate/Fe(II)-dependent dioxygenase YbiX